MLAPYKTLKGARVSLSYEFRIHDAAIGACRANANDDIRLAVRRAIRVDADYPWLRTECAHFNLRHAAGRTFRLLRLDLPLW